MKKKTILKEGIDKENTKKIQKETNRTLIAKLRFLPSLSLARACEDAVLNERKLRYALCQTTPFRHFTPAFTPHGLVFLRGAVLSRHYRRHFRLNHVVVE